jgi:general stress protein CsbA
VEAPDCGVAEQHQSRSLVEIDLASLLIGLCRSVLWQIMEAPEEAPDCGVVEQCQSRSLVEIDLVSLLIGLVADYGSARSWSCGAASKSLAR